jgi:hypothetical protein
MVETPRPPGLASLEAPYQSYASDEARRRYANHTKGPSEASLGGTLRKAFPISWFPGETPRPPGSRRSSLLLLLYQEKVEGS